MRYHVSAMTNTKPTNQHILGGFLGGVCAVALFVLLAHLDILPFPERVSEPPKDGETTIVALDVADIVERSNPAVVSVVVSRDVPVLEEYDEDPFSEFFGGSSPFRFRVPRLRQNGTERQEVGSGSGFFISR